MSFFDLPLGFYVVAAIAILVTGVTKSGLGGGGVGIAVPLMSMFVPPPQAAGVMLPILCAMDAFSWLAYRGRASRKHLVTLIPGALIGIGLGALAFGVLSVQMTRLLLGAISVLFPLNHWLGLTARIVSRFRAEQRLPGPLAGTVWGATSGFTSTLAHAGGPPFSVYMLPQRLDKTTLVATSVIFFMVMNYTKLVPYYFLGQLSPTNLGLSLLLAPLAPLGVRLGIWLHGRLNETLFYRVNYLLLFATGVKLIVDGLRG